MTDSSKDPTTETIAQRVQRMKEGASPTVVDDPLHAAFGSQTGEKPKQASSGERVRTANTLLPESNDVILGDQSSRKDGPKTEGLRTDGSKSPHDASSGGSRQAEGHRQQEAKKTSAVEASKDPALQAEAKARTI